MGKKEEEEISVSNFEIFGFETLRLTVQRLISEYFIKVSTQVKNRLSAM